MLKGSCLNLSESETPTSLDGEEILEVAQSFCFSALIIRAQILSLKSLKTTTAPGGPWQLSTTAMWADVTQHGRVFRLKRVSGSSLFPPTCFHIAPPPYNLQRLLSMIDRLLSGGTVLDKKQVSFILSLVESSLGLIAPFMSKNRTQVSKAHTGNVPHCPSPTAPYECVPGMFYVYYEMPKLRFSHNKNS